MERFTHGSVGNHTVVMGVAGTTPRHVVTEEGMAITQFRLASPRVCGETSESEGSNWLLVVTYGQLALNVAQSVHDGECVVVAGILRVCDWEHAGSSGSSVEIMADAVGHNLVFGTTIFSRNINALPLPESHHFKSVRGQSRPS